MSEGGRLFVWSSCLMLAGIYLAFMRDYKKSITAIFLYLDI